MENAQCSVCGSEMNKGKCIRCLINKVKEKKTMNTSKEMFLAEAAKLEQYGGDVKGTVVELAKKHGINKNTAQGYVKQIPKRKPHIPSGKDSSRHPLPPEQVDTISRPITPRFFEDVPNPGIDIDRFIAWADSRITRLQSAKELMVELFGPISK